MGRSISVQVNRNLHGEKGRDGNFGGQRDFVWLRCDWFADGIRNGGDKGAGSLRFHGRIHSGGLLRHMCGGFISVNAPIMAGETRLIPWGETLPDTNLVEVPAPK